ncbi:MAG: hypothetical protein FWC27_15010 [Firmicutes bacterium]|nr:hypothetical protein [Bacillota bacterium]
MEFDKVAYGKLFSILAEQAQAMATGVYVAQGSLAGYEAMLILYPTSRQCAPPEPGEPT